MDSDGGLKLAAKKFQVLKYSVLAAGSNPLMSVLK
jgi:hypothetical protein